MAVISISVTESSEQVVAGIPRSVSISTNISSTIFYTLDDSDPTLSSSIYTSALYLPINKPSVKLKILATNGVDFSSIITESYFTNMLDNARLPHAGTDGPAGSNIPDLYPFGTNENQPTGIFLNPGDAGITVDDQALPSTPTTFDSDGYPSGFTNNPYTIENYSILYSTTDAQGNTGPKVGNLPASVKIQQEDPVPETTSQFTNTFDPRAFVIFQDFSKENPDDPAQINNQFLSLEDPNKVRDGNKYFTSGLDSPAVSGSFLRSHYNPRDNTMSYYYYDSWSNRWMISKAPYIPTGSFDGNMAGIAAGRGNGSQWVYEWSFGRARILF